MFTGLIQDVGKIEFISSNEVRVNTLLEVKSLGESIAVNGVCLTVKEFDKKVFSADVSPETLKSTSLAFLRSGDYVNLEKSLTPQTLMGGHIVQGHVDGTVKVLELDKCDGFFKLVLILPKQLEKYMVVKGSVAVDGISLTIAYIKSDKLEIWVIPETYNRTNLRYKKSGDFLNIEVDIVAKYIEKLIKKHNSCSNITTDLLIREGFL